MANHLPLMICVYCTGWAFPAIRIPGWVIRWKNRLELRMHYDGNCGAFIFLLIVSMLLRYVRIRDFFMLIFRTTMWQKLHKKGSWAHTPTPRKSLYKWLTPSATKVVDFVRFCNSGYCLPSVIGLASSCSFCSSYDNIFIMASTLSLMIMILSLATLIPYRILSNIFITISFDKSPSSALGVLASWHSKGL